MSAPLDEAVSIVWQLVRRYSTDPGFTTRALQRILTQNPLALCQASLVVFRAHDSQPGVAYLAKILGASPACHAALINAESMPLPDAVELTGYLASGNRRLSVELLNCGHELPPSRDRDLERALELVSALGQFDLIVYPILKLLRHPSPRIRSKVVRLLNPASRGRDWLREHWRSEDPRIRANLIEGLWHAQSPAAQELLREAVGDAHHRVVANALVGLHYLGEEDALTHLQEMTEHPSPAFRAAAAWALGHTRDRRALPALTKLLSDPERNVRLRAQHSIDQLPPEEQVPPDAGPVTASPDDAAPASEVAERSAAPEG